MAFIGQEFARNVNPQERAGMPCNESCDELMIQDRLVKITYWALTLPIPLPVSGHMERMISKAWLWDAERQQPVLSKQVGTRKHQRLARSDEDGHRQGRRRGDVVRGDIVGVAVLAGR